MKCDYLCLSSVPKIVLFFAWLVLFQTLLLASFRQSAFGQVSLQAVEVTQAIQNINETAPWSPGNNNTVPLIARKKTIVRAYFTSTSEHLLKITGTLMGKNATGTFAPKPSENGLPLSAATTSPGLPAKRDKITESLYFLLPDSWTEVGNVSLKIGALLGEDGEAVTCTNCNGQEVSVTFVVSSPLKVRFIKLRYTSPVNGQFYEPTDTDLGLIRSWLRRAYPIASTHLVEAPILVADFPLLNATEFRALAANTIVTSIREQEINEFGEDPAFRYIGLVFDPYEDDTLATDGNIGKNCGDGINLTEMEFRGGANVSSGGTNLVDNVASAPVGPPGCHHRLKLDTTWDSDPSYGDWYTGHELAHLLGRNHVQACGEDDPIDSSYPFTSGRLSGPAKEIFGFDAGDSVPDSTGLPIPISLRPLNGLIWHDVMTYCDRVWISTHVYKAIRLQLELENGGGTQNPPPGNGEPDTNPPAAPTGLRISKVHQIRDVAVDLDRDFCSPGLQNRLFLAPCGITHSDTVETTAAYLVRFRAWSPEVWSLRAGHPFLKQAPRLVTEPFQTPGVEKQTGDFLSVIATVNLTQKTGSIRSLKRLTRAIVRPEGKPGPVLIRLIGEMGTTISEYPAILRKSTDIPKGQDQTGLANAIIPIPKDSPLSEVRLVLFGKEVASFPISKGKPELVPLPIDELQERPALPAPLPPPGEQPVGSSPLFRPPEQPEVEVQKEPEGILLAWDALDQDTERSQLRFTIRVSLDDGAHWQTLGANLLKAEIRISSAQIKAFRSQGAKKLLVKVIASDGFNADEQVKEISLSSEP